MSDSPNKNFIRVKKIHHSLLLAGILGRGWLQLLPSASAASAMQPGWNLGNTLDAVPAETPWGTK